MDVRWRPTRSRNCRAPNTELNLRSFRSSIIPIAMSGGLGFGGGASAIGLQPLRLLPSTSIWPHGHSCRVATSHPLSNSAVPNNYSSRHIQVQFSLAVSTTSVASFFVLNRCALLPNHAPHVATVTNATRRSECRRTMSARGYNRVWHCRMANARGTVAECAHCKEQAALDSRGLSFTMV